jgi:transcriptional regulator with XRE-family HTH domain
MNKIKKLRSEKGLTLKELSEKADIGIASIARLEAGGKAYSSTLGKIARALEVDLAELMEFEAISAKKEGHQEPIKELVA